MTCMVEEQTGFDSCVGHRAGSHHMVHCRIRTKQISAAASCPVLPAIRRA